mmetsp:Transcript_18490/g.26850  ORF Transcript_18490/g.26850 Transcript_18490/m.26850 type:complete len:157 (-) Transcript_18490:882-1352(-)
MIRNDINPLPEPPRPLQHSRDEGKSQPPLIPNKRVFGVLFEGTEQEIKRIRDEKHACEFVKAVRTHLMLFDKSQNKYSDRILLCTMQCVENFILGKSRGLFRERLVIECVSDFFGGDEDIIRKMIQLLMPKIKNYKWFRRNMKKAIRFFANLLLTK